MSFVAAALLVVAACGGADTAPESEGVGSARGVGGLTDAPPSTWHDTGRTSAARTGHTATLLANGRVLVAGGVTGPGHSAEIFDEMNSAWRATNGAMNVVRTGHTATLLPSGQVLAVSGPVSGDADTAELYDPVADRWTTAAPPAAKHVRGHTATLTQDSRILVVGGESSAAELFDPGSSQWAATAAMDEPRRQHAATLLPDGRVLITGGLGGAGAPLATATVYDPSVGAWKPARSMSAPRASHLALLLADGRVLVAGGAAPELYDPQRDTWSPTTTAPDIPSGASATLLPTGKALVITGCGPSPSCLPTYDPVANAWTTGPSLVGPRTGQTSTLLAAGRVLVVGGLDGDKRPAVTTELSDPVPGAWTTSTGPAVPRTFHTMTLMPDGRVLAAGGQFTGSNTRTTDFYQVDRASGQATWTAGPPMVNDHVDGAATLLADGSVLVIGSSQGAVPAERYDPVTHAWSITGPATPLRNYGGNTLTLLDSGRVLAVGSCASPQPQAAQEYTYDAKTKIGTFADTGPMQFVRCGHVASPLPGGDVLVVGGFDPSNGQPTAIAEVYGLASGTWSLTQPLPMSCGIPYAARLRDGRPLVVCNGSAYIFTWDATARSGQWQTAAPLLYPRDLPRPNETALYGDATMTALADGTVLVTGGYSAVRQPLPAERFDPASGIWTSAGFSYWGRASQATSVVLANGDLLSTGGVDDRRNVLSGSDLLDLGSGAARAAQPEVTSDTSLQLGAAVGLSGNLFRGLSEASGGNGGQQSSSAHPVVTLRTLDNRASIRLDVDPVVGWSDSRFTSLPLTGFPVGPALLTLSVNGVPASPAAVIVEPAAAEAATSKSRTVEPGVDAAFAPPAAR